MARKIAATSDIRLKRIILIHKMLRDGIKTTNELFLELLIFDPEINERTIKADIDFLRKLGAPIPKGNRHHGFKYSSPFTLLEAIEGNKLSEIDDLVAYLQKIIDKSPSALGLDEILITLEQALKSTNIRKNPFIEYENVESVGLKRLEEFYRYVKSGKTYDITYTPFGKDTELRTILPILLKEYNHRWTLIAFDSVALDYQNFPIDRVGQIIKLSSQTLKMEKKFNSKNYFQHVIGNTLTREQVTGEYLPVETIQFKIKIGRAYYVETKKIHNSQIRRKDLENNDYMVFEIYVIPNNEMWSKFLEFGADIQIISPLNFIEKHKEIINRALKNYIE